MVVNQHAVAIEKHGPAKGSDRQDLYQFIDLSALCDYSRVESIVTVLLPASWIVWWELLFPRTMFRTGIAITLAAVLFSAPWSAGADDLILSSTPAEAANPLIFNAKNWAGFVAETNFSSPVNNSVTAVGGSWTVPLTTASANSARNGTYSVQWVGIDGFSDSTVEQVGTEATYSGNGPAFYSAWYEMYPGSLTTINNFPIHPGDSITASVVYSPPGFPNEFALSIEDNTTSSGTTTYQAGSASMSSAEWIVEAPTVGGGIAPLPGFGSVSFTSDWATIGSTTGPIDNYANWQVTQVNMSDTKWGDVMTPSAITDVGSGTAAQSNFTVVQTPEPSTLVALASASAVMAARALAIRRRRRNIRGNSTQDCRS